MTSSPSNLDDEAFRNVVEALIESGQAVFIYDADDNLRSANETYRGMFLVGYEGPFTFPDMLRHGAAHGLGVRIDAGVRAGNPSRPISWTAAGSGSSTRCCPTAG
jgi:hypothetical protein